MALRERIMPQRVGIMDCTRYFKNEILGLGDNFWTFLRQPKKVSLVHIFNAIQGPADAENPTEKKYRLLNNRVQNISREYKTGEKIHFLRGIAHLQQRETL